MTRRGKDETGLHFKRQARNKNRNELSSKLDKASVSHSSISYNEHERILSALRGKGNDVHDKFTIRRFTRIVDSVIYLQGAVATLSSGPCIVTPYEIDESASFLVSTMAILEAIKIDPFILSKDGFIIIGPKLDWGAIVDYEEFDRESPVEVTLLANATNLGE